MFCGKCGYELEDIDKFCPNCGAEVRRPQVQESGAAADRPQVQEGGAAADRPQVQESVEEESPALPEAARDDGAGPGGDDDGSEWDTGEFEWNPGQGASWEDSLEDGSHDGNEMLQVEHVSMPVSPGSSYHVDPMERHELIFLTKEEASEGCRKIIEVDGHTIAIDIPPEYKAEKAMSIKGYGYEDPQTGEKGNLKVQFLID